MFQKPRVARLVVNGLVAHIVCNPINLDRQPRIATIEIEYIGPRPMLPPELESKRPPLQFAP